jgi:hypothetical protein
VDQPTRGGDHDGTVITRTFCLSKVDRRRDEDTWNHRWGWHLAPDGEGTAVTAFYDCTRVPEDGLRILSRGEWGRPILEASLERLEALVTA